MITARPSLSWNLSRCAWVAQSFTSMDARSSLSAKYRCPRALTPRKFETSPRTSTRPNCGSSRFFTWPVSWETVSTFGSVRGFSAGAGSTRRQAGVFSATGAGAGAGGGGATTGAGGGRGGSTGSGAVVATGAFGGAGAAGAPKRSPCFELVTASAAR